MSYLNQLGHYCHMSSLNQENIVKNLFDAFTNMQFELSIVFPLFYDLVWDIL